LKTITELYRIMTAWDRTIFKRYGSIFKLYSNSLVIGLREGKVSSKKLLDRHRKVWYYTRWQCFQPLKDPKRAILPIL